MTAEATQRFSFSFVSARVTYDPDGRSVVTGPDGVSRDVTGVGTLVFTDGTIEKDDGAPLVDDLYYYARNLDVWSSRLKNGTDADKHFEVFGSQQGRNPNAYFDTLGYLATYQDVANSGGNALKHYDVLGWRQGRKAIAKPLYDTDATADAVIEGAADGTGVGVTFSWGGWTSPNLSFAITADAPGGGFRIDAGTGRVTVAAGSKLDYETSGAGHGYAVTVTATLGEFSISMTLTIAVTDANDHAPVFTSRDQASTAENVSTATAVYTAVATDADGAAPNNAIRYGLAAGIDDNDRFKIDATTGAVTFKVSPDEEHSADQGGNNVYDLVVTATDGGNPARSVSKAVAITSPTTGAFTLTIDAQEKDTVTLSTGTTTDISHTYQTLMVGIKPTANPVFAAHDAGSFELHLSAVADTATVHIDVLPDNGRITDVDGTLVKDGATLSAHDLAGLKFTPTNTTADHAANLIYTVKDGTSVSTETLPIDVQHGRNLTLTGTAEKDVIVGGAGHDVLDAAGGGNYLTGGGGADTFVFDAKTLADARGTSSIT